MSLLPTEPTQVNFDLANQNIYIYGEPGVGKSTFCSHFEKPLFLATEDRHKHLSLYLKKITDWKMFLSTCADIAGGKHNYKTVVIDTIDNLYPLCRAYVYEKIGIDHEADLGYGKGWDLVRGEFFRTLKKLSMLPYGLVLIGHSEMEEVKTRTGSIQRAVPGMPDKVRKELVAMMDFVFFAHMILTKEGEKRVLRLSPSENAVAKISLPEGSQVEFPQVIPLEFDVLNKYFQEVADERV